VAEKFKQYRKRNSDMPVYRASAYLIELGLAQMDGGRELWCRLRPDLLARLDIYALKRRIPQHQAVQEIVELGLKAVEQRGYVMSLKL